jgi:hypothetical protein
MKTELEMVYDLLSKACEIIVDLECNADESFKKEIDEFFDSIDFMKYHYKVEDEIRINYSGDDEAQDSEIFGENKI